MGTSVRKVMAFLFADIEGSTRLLHELGDDYVEVLAGYRDEMELAIAAAGGATIDTQGDGLFAGFPTARGATAAAVGAMQGIDSRQWPEDADVRVRMGVHVGEVLEVATGYVGMEIHRAARIAAAGNGGQLLLSQSMADSLDSSDLPEGAHVRELGSYRFKDLLEPEPVFQLDIPGLETSFPPIRSLEIRAHNIPVALTSFVGRSAELGHVRELINQSRLVTITGAPGAGKTRLAYELAATVLDGFEDGVWTLELAPLRDGAHISTELLSVLGLEAPVSVTPLEALCSQLLGWQTLLVVDNCEHLVAEAAEVVNRILGAAPGVKVLATSRRSLGIAGEVAWRLPPLETPSEDLEAKPFGSDSMRLFVERATSVEPRLDLAKHAETVADICRRLDGLPLAVELVVPRLRSLTIPELAEHLDDRFRLLSQGDPTGHAHHQTLRGLVDWSYDLLTSKEQNVYRRLSAFRGGWLPAAAETVGASENVHAGEVFDIVDRLVANSLVVRTMDDSGPRFTMLETMRDHGESLLVHNGEIAAVRDAHLHWILSLTSEAGPAIDGAQQKVWLAALNLELDNLRAAFDWGISEGNAEVALDAASRIPRYWWLTSEIVEGADWLDRLLAAAPDAAPSIRARGLAASGFLINMLGRSAEAESQLREAVRTYRELDEEPGLAWALHFLGRAAWDSTDAMTLRAYQEEAGALFVKNGIGQGVFLARILELGVVRFLQQDAETAGRMAHEVVAMAEQSGAPNALAHAYEILAMADEEMTKTSEVFACYRKALGHYRGLGNRDCSAHCLSGVAHTLTLQGRVREASELMGAIEAMLESLSVVPPGYERYLYERTAAVLGDAEPEARVKGRGLKYDEAIERAIELVG